MMHKYTLLLQKMELYHEAERLRRQVLTISENVFSTEHTDAGITVNNLAAVLRKLKRFEEAEALYRRAHAIFNKTLGSEHSATHGVIQNWRTFYLDAGQPTKAAALVARYPGSSASSFGDPAEEPG